MDTATCAPGAGTPGANASALDTGPDEHGEESLAGASANSSPVKRRSAWHGAPKSKPRKSKRGTAVYAGAPFYRSTLGPIPAPKGTTIRQPGQFAAAIASRRPYPDGPVADPERQALWRRVLAEVGGDVARADVVLAARLRPPLPIEQIARHNAVVDETLRAFGWPKWLRRPRPAAVATMPPRAPALETSVPLFGWRRLPPLEWRLAA